MTIEERARRLVGDMPWVTEHLTPAQIADLPKQIAAAMHAQATEQPHYDELLQARVRQLKRIEDLLRAILADELNNGKMSDRHIRMAGQVRQVMHDVQYAAQEAEADHAAF